MPNIIAEIKNAMEAGEIANVYYTLIPRLIRMHGEGLIPVLPCKVGDRAYLVDNIVHHRIEAYTISKITIEFGKILFWYSLKNISEPLALCSLTDFGKTVFLTREAAEAALKKEDV